ncbi:hypothetical protein [Clostridium sardiniense]|uniref:hypothetical protein n=1 Tax=Clostridium sardiniense TaxID=29369 RepID=UPI00195BC9C2|nr:hypothetical protein [Clostridium sardiniense]MBM7835603.1 chromosome segregation ATPase [Clostridium sardiniense]
MLENKKIKNIFKKIRDKKDKFEAKMKYKKSYKYYIFACIFFLGYGVFFSSGYIFDTNRERKSTEIGIENKMTNSIVKIKSEQYNPNNKLLQVNLDIEKTNILFGNDIEVTAIERADLNKNLEVKTIRLDESQYVLLIQAPKKWTNIAIEIKEKNIVDSSSTKVFIDEKLCTKNNELQEGTLTDYLVESVDLEINNINLEIENYNKEIEKDNKIIAQTEKEIKKLEENIKYEIKEEADRTKQKIESLKSEIENLKVSIEEINKQIETSNEKINKLNLKKEDYKKEEH